MEVEFGIWDFLRDGWRWFRNLSPLRIDNKKVSLTYASHSDGKTELSSVAFKLAIMNRSTTKVFLKFSNPIFRHDKVAYNLISHTHDLSVSQELPPRSITVFNFDFNIVGGLITVKEYKVNTFQFEITYTKDKKIEKIFVDDYREIGQRNILKFEPIEDGRPTYHFGEGMEFLIKGETSKANELFNQSGLTIEDLAVCLARNGDAYLYNQRFGDAIIVYKKSKKYFEEIGLPQEDPIWGVLYGNLATAYCYNKEYKEALPLFDRSIDILSKDRASEETLKKVYQKREECTMGED